MQTAKNIILTSLLCFAIGAMQAGLAEYFGYIHPLFVILSFIGVGLVVSRMTSFWELLYVAPFSLGIYSFLFFSLPDLLDSFMHLDSIFSAIFVNALLSLVCFMGYFSVGMKLVFDRIKYQVLPGGLFIFSASLALFLVYFTVGWSSNLAYLLAEWTEYLIWLPIFGSVIYTYMLIFIATFLAVKCYSKVVLITLGLFVLSHLGYFILPPKTVESKESLKVTIVQYPYFINELLTDARKLQREFIEMLKDKKGDLVLYPESSSLVLVDNPAIWMKNPYIQATGLNHEAALLSGYKIENEKVYNSAILIQKNGNLNFYYKNKLFPVGERSMPLVSSFSTSGRDSTVSVKENNPLWQLKGFNILPILCFENFHNFYWQQRISSFDEPVHLVTLQSGESWVKDKLFRKILLTMLRLQVKEMGVPLVKSDTAGPSAFIDANGRVVESSEKLIYTIGAEVHKVKENSFYARWGVTPFLILVLLQVGLALLEARFKKKFSNKISLVPKNNSD